MGEERKLYKVLVGKPEGRRPLGRPRRRWEDGVRMDFRETGLGGVDWIRLSQDRDRIGLEWLRIGSKAGCCEQGNETCGSIKRAKFLDQLIDY
jgi:hypothetical protein